MPEPLNRLLSFWGRGGSFDPSRMSVCRNKTFLLRSAVDVIDLGCRVFQQRMQIVRSPFGGHYAGRDPSWCPYSTTVQRIRLFGQWNIRSPGRLWTFNSWSLKLNCWQNSFLWFLSLLVERYEFVLSFYLFRFQSLWIAQACRTISHRAWCICVPSVFTSETVVSIHLLPHYLQLSKLISWGKLSTSVSYKFTVLHQDTLTQLLNYPIQHHLLYLHIYFSQPI